MRITRSIGVACSRDRMWFLLTDVEQIQRWVAEILDQEDLTDGPIGPGTRSRVLVREGSKEVWYDHEILMYDEPDHLEFQLAGGSLGAGPMTVGYRVTGEDGRLAVHYRADWKPHGLVLTFMTPLITIMASRNARGAMERLKELAESEPEASPAH